VPHFFTAAAPSGAGKTYAATRFTCERIPRNVKSAIVQPTIALCRQSYTDARKRFPDIQDRIRAIFTRRGSGDKIAHRITSYLNDRDETGDLVFVTHAGSYERRTGIALTPGT
jgi:superfamily II DNA or RNA helicase